MGITSPIEIGEVYRTRKKITQNTISKKKRTGRNGKKISFTPEWAHRKQGGNNTGKYITVAIEEEDKTIIGFMREHDTDPRPEIQITKISPRAFPIKIYIRAFFQLVALLGTKQQHLLNSTLTLPKLRPPPTPFP